LIFADNPLDQCDQQTPIAIIRPVNPEKTEETKEEAEEKNEEV
jgi:hypothetical protein